MWTRKGTCIYNVGDSRTILFIMALTMYLPFVSLQSVATDSVDSNLWHTHHMFMLKKQQPTKARPVTKGNTGLVNSYC